MVNVPTTSHVIDVQLVLDIGVIGYRNHAGKLISILKNNPDCKIKYIYHPTKSENDQFTNNFEKLRDCDAVIIASPNSTHYNFIEKLAENFNGYIFCEKPPVTNNEELKKLEKLTDEWKQKIFFNFMFRFSELSNLIKNKIDTKQLGDIIHIDIYGSKGLAFKKEYKNSWRANGKTNLHNILDANTIHYIDLIGMYLGKIKNSTYFPSLVSNNGTSFDTSYVVIKYENDITLSIFNSYATPLINELSIIGTNGYLTIKDNNLIIKSPRDTFDKDGFFTDPPIYDESNFSIQDDVENSLKKSLDYFLTCVKKGEKFDIGLFKNSIETNRLILKLKDMN